MARFETLRLGVWPAHIRTLLRTVALAGVLLLPVAIVAGWLEKIAGTAIRGSAPMSPALETAVRYVRGLPARADVVPLAAQGTPEGHWRFVSKSGEVYTVGTPDEMKRALTVLHPEARTGARLALYMTQDTVLRDRVALKALPAGIDLSVVVGADSYRLLRRSEAAGERFFAEIRPNLVVEMGDKRLFEEAVWQLARPLDAARVRVLALEPGGPATLPTSPRIDPASKRALVDVIDPTNLVPAMRGVAGQTLVMVGRLERDLIYVRPSSGPEHVLVAKDLLKGAAAADVSLVVLLTTSTPRQPGGRNWLWQKVEVKGLEEALQRARVADFYNALAPPNGRFAVTAKAAGHLRTQVAVVPIADLPKLPASRPLSDILGDAAASLTGRVITTGIEANIRSAAHQRDIDWRLFSVLPANVQLGYFALLLVGFLGVPLARVWWAHLWPPEDPAEYAGRTGYWAARLIRDSVFVAVFLPLTALLSAPINLGRQVWDAILAPVRAWRWLTRGKRRAAAPSSSEAALGSSQVALGSPLSARHAAEAPSLGSYRPNR
jgi:hypothetical protein